MNDIDAIIAETWPERWAIANCPPYASKKRTALRARWKTFQKWKEWRAANPDAACVSCVHFKKYQHSPGERHYCEAESGGGWFRLTQPHNVCIKWRVK